MKITKIIGREILDSRGNPTVEADVHLEDGTLGRAAVPSGASVGTYEAHELRDGDSKRYGGLGVLKAVANINDTIAHDLNGLDVEDQRTLDHRMIALDGTTTKEHLGANAILAVSMALLKAAAESAHQPVYRYIGGEMSHTLPVPLINVINGGRHAVGSTDIQEFMIVPTGAETFHQAMQMGMEIYQTLEQIMKDKNWPTTVGDEGGFGIKAAKNEEALTLLVQAMDKTGYKPGHDVMLALDVASSEFYENGSYVVKSENRTLTSDEMSSWMAELSQKYPIFSIEDPLHEDDWPGYQKLTASLGQKLQIVGDDLFVTNPVRLQKGIEERAANAILVKLNQIGTVTETIDTVRLAKDNGYAAIISNRSGETIDSFIADLAVALGTGQIKTGSVARSERTAKYNQLLRIAEELGPVADYASLG